MARILVGSMPFISHVNPATPIVRKLVERGHDVRWYTGINFKEKVEATGARYLPMKAGHDFDEKRLEEEFPGPKGLSTFAQFKWSIKHIFIDSVPGQLEDLTEILRDFPADVILSETTFGAPSIMYERGGPPWAVFSMFPLSIASRDTAPFGLALAPSTTSLGRLRNRALNTVFNKVLFRDVTTYMNKMRRELGVAPTTSPFDSQVSPFLFLQGTTEAFEYPRTDLPPQVHFIGPLLPAAPADFAPPAWWPELESGRPVVLVTQGTIANDFRDLLMPALEALADTDYLVIATTGNKPVESLNLDPMPSNVRIERFIPYDRLLPHVDVMVTNAGYGGVQLAIANGVPLVAAGRTEEKPEITRRIAWTGAGIDLHTQNPRPEQIREAVAKALSDPSYRENAGRVAADFARHDAPTEAAMLVERLAETHLAVYRTQTAPEGAGAATPELAVTASGAR